MEADLKLVVYWPCRVKRLEEVHTGCFLDRWQKVMWRRDGESRINSDED